MERAFTEISRIARDLGMDSALALERIRARWGTLFSGALPHHAAPRGLRKGQLLVIVDSPAWLQELNFMKSRMLEKLGAFGVTDLRFKLGAVRSQQDGRPASEPPPLSEEDGSFVEELASAVGDEDLREGIRRAVQKSVQCARKP